MVTTIPSDHIADAHKLTADAEIDLFELSPTDGSGTIYFKNDNDVTWLGKLYEGMPIALTGFEKNTDGSSLLPKLTVGDGTVDLSPFKPLVYDGYLEGAQLIHKVVLRDNLENNRDIKLMRIYRVKRVPSYSTLSIEMQLATASDALGFTLPYRQYFPPAFPAVQQ